MNRNDDGGSRITKDSEKVGVAAVFIVIIGLISIFSAFIVAGHIPSAFSKFALILGFTYLGIGLGMALTDIYIVRLEKKIPKTPPPPT